MYHSGGFDGSPGHPLSNADLQREIASDSELRNRSADRYSSIDVIPMGQSLPRRRVVESPFVGVPPTQNDHKLVDKATDVPLHRGDRRADNVDLFRLLDQPKIEVGSEIKCRGQPLCMIDPLAEDVSFGKAGEKSTGLEDHLSGNGSLRLEAWFNQGTEGSEGSEGSRSDEVMDRVIDQATIPPKRKTTGMSDICAVTDTGVMEFGLLEGGTFRFFNTPEQLGEELKQRLKEESIKRIFEVLQGSEPVNPKTLPQEKLPHVLETTDDFVKLLKIMNKPGFQNFQGRKMANACLVFERAKESGLDMALAMIPLGNCSPERWRHIQEIHVVFPSELQAYTVRRADMPHYQEMFQKVLAAIASYSRKIRVVIYDPRYDYSNDFMVVRNNGVKELLDDVGVPDWISLNHMMENQKVDPAKKEKKGKKQRLDPKRQETFQDFGWTTLECSSRRGTKSGEAAPQLKPRSTDPLIVQCFLACTLLARVMNVNWLKPGTILVDPDHPERPEKYAKRLHERNRFEGLRVFQNSLDDLCKNHGDSPNSKIPTLSVVVGLSSLLPGEKSKRYGIVGYMRGSVDSELARTETTSPVIFQVADLYDKIPEERRTVSESLRYGERVKFHKLLPDMIRNPCNMDPQSFHQPFLHYILLMVHKYNMTFSETIGVQTAMEFMHFTSLFFVMSCKCVLSVVPPNGFGPRERGWGIGYLLLHLMKRFHSEMESGGQLYDRYPHYYKPRVPTLGEWERRCHRKVITCLCAFSCYNTGMKTVGSRPRKDAAYKEVYDLLCPDADNAAELGLNHSMAVLSQIGLLPSWIRDHVLLLATSKPIKHFLAKFEDSGVGKGKKGLDGIMQVLLRCLETRFSVSFTLRKIENVVCKVFRIELGNDGSFCDLLDDGQNLFLFEGKTVKISTPGDNKWRKLKDCDCLIPTWPYGDHMTTPAEIALDAGLGTNMPALSQEFRLPEKFWIPNVVRKADYVFSRENRVAEGFQGEVQKLIAIEIGKLREQRKHSRFNQA